MVGGTNKAETPEVVTRMTSGARSHGQSQGQSQGQTPESHYSARSRASLVGTSRPPESDALKARACPSGRENEGARLPRALGSAG